MDSNNELICYFTVKDENDLDHIKELRRCLNDATIGSFSDGYHTFDELYNHRAVLSAIAFNAHKDIAWKSKKHHDPSDTMYDGMFVVGMDTPFGQVTYHYDIEPYWDMFNIKELDYAQEWDGHTPSESADRLRKFAEMDKENVAVWQKVHGFVTPGGDPVWQCSKCGKGIHVYGIEHGTYGSDISDGQWVACPNCGAKIVGEV